jgi:hypothetical protein
MDKLLKEFEEQYCNFEISDRIAKPEMLKIKSFLLHAYQVGVQDSLAVVESKKQEAETLHKISEGFSTGGAIVTCEDLKVSLKALIKKE